MSVPKTSNSLPALAICPEGTGVTWPCDWYGIPSIPNFDICSKCFADHIHHTPLRDHFSIVPKPSDALTACDFHTHRTKQLWTEALLATDIEAFKAYMRMRANIPPCQGANGIIGPSTTRWYSIKPSVEPQIPYFIVCGACHNDYILSSSFANHFELCPRTPGPRDTWTCDVGSHHYVEKTLQSLSDSVDWSAFVYNVSTRTRAPPCPGTVGTTKPGRKWWTPIQAIQGMIVCEACFYDHIATVPTLLQQFIPFNQAQSTGQNWSCDMAVPGIRFAMVPRHVEKNAFQWREGVSRLIAQPCTSNGLSHTDWWTLSSGEGSRPLKNFDICSGCFHSFVVPLDLEVHFTRQIHSPEETRLCDFEACSERGAKYRTKLVEAYAIMDIHLFADYVTALVDISPCGGAQSVLGGRWYGTDSFLACHDCWYHYIRSTPLDALLTRRNLTLPPDQTYICELYSPRQRELLREAATTQPPSFTSFDAACTRRATAYSQYMQALAARDQGTTPSGDNLAVTTAALEQAWKSVE